MLSSDDRLFVELYLLLRQIEPLWWLISFLGDGLVLALIIVPSLYLFQRRSAHQTLFWLVAAVLGSGLFITAVKEVVGRPRPFEREVIAALPIEPPAREIPSGRSFPSGHAQTAVSTAVFLAYRFRRGAPLFLTLACLVALSRIALGAHTPLEVLFGALIGVLGAVTSIWFMKRRERLALSD
jgi:membrane-associated phospholipid phosphatase